MKASGKLDKYGRANEATPAAWKSDYKDYNPAPEQAASAAPVTDVTMSEAPAAAPASTPAAKGAAEEADEDSKKRKKHDGETAEEKAERKRIKAEKKAAKKAKRASMGGENSDESD